MKCKKAGMKENKKGSDCNLVLCKHLTHSRDKFYNSYFFFNIYRSELKRQAKILKPLLVVP